MLDESKASPAASLPAGEDAFLVKSKYLNSAKPRQSFQPHKTPTKDSNWRKVLRNRSHQIIGGITTVMGINYLSYLV
jgi:hypothetical protein